MKVCYELDLQEGREDDDVFAPPKCATLEPGNIGSVVRTDRRKTGAQESQLVLRQSRKTNATTASRI